MSEHVTSAPAKPSSAPQQFQLRTDTTSSFAIGLDDPITPTILSVEIEFRVSMKHPDTDKVVIDYEAKHEMQFSLIAWTGFMDWTEVPAQAVTPYVAMLHDIAVRRAEGTLHEMGIRGLAIPRPTTFDDEEVIAASPK